MYRGLQAEIRLITFITLLCSIIGLLLGHLAWSLIVGGIAYSVYLLRQMNRFYRWLESGDQEALPAEGTGIWGDISDSIRRMQKRHRKHEQRLRAQIQRIQQSTDALRDGVIMLNSLGGIDWWNTAAVQLLRLRDPGDYGLLITNLIRNPSFVNYFTRHDYQDTLVIPSPLNSNERLEIQISVFGNNERMMILRDVTRLERLEQVRQDFVANVSHELRTPLTVLSGYLEMISEDLTPDSPWEKPIIQMQHQAKRMETLVNDLTWLTRLDNENVLGSQTSVNVPELMTRISEDVQPLLQDKHRLVIEGVPVCLQGNRDELYSAFSNLVVNAIKYSPDGGQVSVQWLVDDEGLHFSVSDQGLGIELSHIPRLTERFYRVDASRSKASGGTGLGLAIVKHVLLRHNAELEIRSQPGKGSTFLCHFPSERVLDIAPPVKVLK